MKTRFWIAALACLFVLCIGLSVFLLWPGRDADTVQIFSEGKLVHTLSLKEDQTVTVQTDRGTNTVTICNGKVAVTQASCPDGYCMARGYCSSGAQIVCLPNRLVIQFANSGTLDGVSG